MKKTDLEGQKADLFTKRIAGIIPAIAYIYIGTWSETTYCQKERMVVQANK